MAQHRTVVVHDYFAIRGGGERLALTLAEALEADIVYSFREKESYPESMFRPSIDFNLPPMLRQTSIRTVALAWHFFRAQNVVRDYSIRIFSGSFAPFAAPDRQAGGVNIFYCHTPPRFLYDQREHFRNRLPGPLRLLAPALLRLFERGYTRSVARMDVVVANSQNTRARIQRYLGRDSVIVYPPVDTDRFLWRGQGDYYLSTARLSSLKRVDKIVEAFLRMPEKKLVVASGGEDLEALKQRAAGAPNITFRGWVDDDELLDLVGNATATIYLPREEDFGMSPVESMAAGKPVIGVAEGGLLETIVPEETGILLPPDFSDQDLVAAVRRMTPERALAMRPACEARARRFTRETFVSAMREVIEDALRKASGKDRDTAGTSPPP
ncbi:glycosyltransferase [Chelativorans sp. AA-79]|uniref:glycosyltransferase n=1 Tax=Chelativorans sp. AA-79 TaxID=3028735 RepID=UPI0023F7FBB1|nr:glycosyltransferase [Chelativorans sp. AA-79]WEX08344.1 glycosyltransferase [Chelativorans sp. AA-79]